MTMAVLYDSIRLVAPSFAETDFHAIASNRQAGPLVLNLALLSLQAEHGGVSLSLEGLLLNPFDMLLPKDLNLDNTVMFLERALHPEEPDPPEVLEQIDFEQSWAPRSYTDRQDNRTVVCADHSCPRSVPQGNPLVKRLVLALLSEYVEGKGKVPAVDMWATRLYKEVTRGRSRASLPSRQPDTHAALAMPGWMIVEPHFPDGYRHLGHRGMEDETEDFPQFHSQLFSPRAHRERSDWWLVRSSKVWLPVDVGPLFARNVLPRSVIDLGRRLLSLRLTPADIDPLRFGAAATSDMHQRALRVPTDALDLLDNSMMESLGIGAPVLLPREAALPGSMGGFRTFRDVRVVGRSSCVGGGSLAQVRAAVQLSNSSAAFFCRAAARPEAHEGALSAGELAVLRSCEAALSSTAPGGSFSVEGSPAFVNAVLSLLAYNGVPKLSHTKSLDDGNVELDHRLTSEELDDHFANLTIKVYDLGCLGSPVEQKTGDSSTAVATAMVKALLDDVEDHITVVAHSASRCELLERLGESFRVLYRHLPVLVSCECPEDNVRPGRGGSCAEPSTRPHKSIPAMTVVDVPYDYGLSRGKRLLAQLTTTEFVLVLDDDFVRSPLSCIECMLWHMRSRMHSLTLPFDLLGFPILEDERNFGAFRGQLRATSGRLLLEPMAGDTEADGCMRVGIHPMAFLARTSRFRLLRFEDKLQVGEHEQFFYANKYLGLHAAVCFDSTFPHFRVQMAAGYKKRRERMQDLMTKEFEKIGFPSVMYLLYKYDALNGANQDEFIQKDVPPWQISDDTCGPQPDPPAEFALFFAAVLSSADDRGAQYRQILRGGSPSAWLPRLAAATGTRWAFFLPEAPDPVPALVREEEEFGDLVFTQVGTPAEQLRSIFSFLRDFQFRWLIVAQQDSYVHIDVVFRMFSTMETQHRTFLGPVSDQVSPHFFALSRDVHALLASHRLARWLRTDFGGAEQGASTASAALNAWLSMLSLRKLEIPGYYVDGRGARCPDDGAVIHPVNPDELVMLSDASLQGPACVVLRQGQQSGSQ
eukprot:TRINITY_DN36080_c0_g1_i1.p1 TRINITY_DN36080_c0_g1~~TRINITY_DN36080_c0_g1_i1.p1  ORF type:complete len:1200 (-),score=174.69 TRINITY_DN36080_c0_g1_i1:46-3162(-)